MPRGDNSLHTGCAPQTACSCALTLWQTYSVTFGQSTSFLALPASQQAGQELADTASTDLVMCSKLLLCSLLYKPKHYPSVAFSSLWLPPLLFLSPSATSSGSLATSPACLAKDPMENALTWGQQVLTSLCPKPPPSPTICLSFTTFSPYYLPP